MEEHGKIWHPTHTPKSGYLKVANSLPQSILVLVVKWRHHTNVPFEQSMVQSKHCAIIMSNSIDRLSSTLAWQQLDVWINISFKFNKLCHATRLWHDVDSNLVLNLCKTQCIHYDNWSCISYLYPKGLVGLYPGSMFESVLSATTVWINNRSTVELKYN